MWIPKVKHSFRRENQKLARKSLEHAKASDSLVAIFITGLWLSGHEWTKELVLDVEG